MFCFGGGCFCFWGVFFAFPVVFLATGKNWVGKVAFPAHPGQVASVSQFAKWRLAEGTRKVVKPHLLTHGVGITVPLPKPGPEPDGAVGTRAPQILSL